MLDKDHASDKSDDTEGYGWIQDLQKRDNGLWGKVKWSDIGEQVVNGGRFKFLSPVWNRGECRELGGNLIAPTHLTKVALTNSPNLSGLTPITK